MVRRFSLLAALLLGACGPDRNGFVFPDGGDPDVDTARDAADVPSTPRDVPPIPITDTGPNPNDMTIVYAHSDTDLYTVNPRTNAFAPVGAFGFPNDGNNHSMTDLAVDADGGIVGVTQNALYRIDARTAACTLLAPLPGMHTFVGLTYLPVGVLDASAEVLVGGAIDGTYWRIDARSGVATMIGTFQGGWMLSGDIVSIAGAATYVTVRRTSTGTDSLATLDPRTGVLRIIGDTNNSRIFGLGYWRSTLYGFTRTGQFITINPATGAARQISMPVMQFSGAGVTTLAPVAPG